MDFESTRKVAIILSVLAASSATSATADRGDDVPQYGATPVMYENAQLTPTLVAGDSFGTDLAISGNIVIVGAGVETLSATPPGAVFLFDLATGKQLRRISAAAAGAGGGFGSAVDVSGNVAIIGDFGKEAGATGAAYLFDVTTGQRLFTLTGSDAAAGDRFGAAVAIDGNTAIVGAFRADDSGSSSGAAYLFDVTTGEEIAKLTASDGATGDQFGRRVAISGNTALVSAPNGGPGGVYAVYVFDLVSGDEVGKLVPGDITSLAISRDIAIAGTPSLGALSAGQVNVYDARTGDELYALTPSDGRPSDEFGRSLDISGDLAVIGAEDADGLTEDSGAAYVFDVRTGSELYKLLPSGQGDFLQFGTKVAIDRNTITAVADGSIYVYQVVPEPSAAVLALMALVIVAGQLSRATSQTRRSPT